MIALLRRITLSPIFQFHLADISRVAFRLRFGEFREGIGLICKDCQSILPEYPREESKPIFNLGLSIHLQAFRQTPVSLIVI